jgi:hypothetical protein
MLKGNLIKFTMLTNVDSIGKVFLQEALLKRKKRCASGRKSSKECLMVLCCTNASGNHKMKLVAVVKSQKSMII